MTSLPSVAGRDLTLDAARGLALLSMFVAHTAPSGGPLDLLNLSEFLTAALFATLIGAGAQHSAWHGTPWAVTLVRGLSLVAVGLALDELGAQVHIVLTQLGVLTLLAALMARWRSPVIAAVGAAVGLLGSLALPSLRAIPWALEGPERLLWYLTVGDAYRLTTMVLWAGVGILFARRQSRLAARRRTTALILLGLTLLAGVLLLLKRGNVLAITPYSGTVAEVVLDTVLSLLVLVATLLVCTSSMRPAALPLAAMGRMALTLYAAHIAVLAAWVGPLGHVSDDSWVVLAILILGSAVIVTLWEPLRRATGWRGPLEGVIAALASLVAPRRPQPERQGSASP